MSVDLTYVTARFHATNAAQALTAAFWMASEGCEYSYHVRTAIEDLKLAADALGFDLVARPAASTSEAA